MFFKDKAMFFTSLITPLILLVLYATFLAKVYRDSFTASSAIEFSDKIIGGVVGGQLVASLVSVGAGGFATLPLTTWYPCFLEALRLASFPQ